MLDNPHTDNKKTEGSATGWRRNATFVTKRVGKTVYDVVTCSAVLFGAGSTMWTLQTSGIAGIAVNASATVASAACAAYNSWTGKTTGLPFYMSAGASLITVASILAKGMPGGYLPIDNINELWTASKEVFFPAAAFFIASTANITQGIQNGKKTKPKGIIDDPQFQYGTCEFLAVISIQHGFSAATAPIVAGLARSLIKKSVIPQTVTSWRELALKHITPAKFYTFGYTIGTVVSAFTHPSFALTQALWSLGFANLDSKNNKELLPDIKRLIKPLAPVSPAPSP